MFWTTAVLWKIIKVLRYLSEMIRYFLARKKELFFCSILDRSTRLSPHLLQQHGKDIKGNTNVKWYNDFVLSGIAFEGDSV